MLRTLFSATILFGALTGSALAQAPDAGCALPFRARGHSRRARARRFVTGLDYSNLRLRTWVNGDLRQDSSTRELIYSPNKLLSYVSQYITLLPGDVIFTGTPGKTQAVTHGDTIEIEIEGVGRLRNSVAVR
jgi:hypothetical protein